MKKYIFPIICTLIFSSGILAQKKTTKEITTKETVQNNVDEGREKELKALKENALEEEGDITPNKVINKYFDALGGAKNLQRIESIIIRSNMTVDGLPIFMDTMKKGNKFRSSQRIEDIEVVQVFDGKEGSQLKEGIITKYTKEKNASLTKATTVEALSFSPQHYQKAIVENIDRKTYNVLINGKNKAYFDAETGLLYKTSGPEGENYIVEYLDVDGVKFPALIEGIINGKKVIIKNENILVNPEIEDDKFRI